MPRIKKTIADVIGDTLLPITTYAGLSVRDKVSYVGCPIDTLCGFVAAGKSLEPNWAIVLHDSQNAIDDGRYGHGYMSLNG